MSLIEPEHTMK